MAEAAAERIIFDDIIYDAPEPYLSLIEDLPEIETQPMAERARDTEYATFTEARFNRWSGSIALSDNVRPVTSETNEQAPKTNLLDMIKATKNGSAEAGAMVGENVAAAVSEVCFKDKHIRSVSVERNEAGQLIQFGQTMINVHGNAITERPDRHPVLQEITLTEALNGHDIEDGLRAGKLKDKYHVVCSIVPDGVPEKNLGPDGDGYFLDSLTFVIQATTEQNTGEVTIENAFVAGVEDAEGLSFEERLEIRLDIKMLTKVYERLGLKPPTTAKGFLEGILIDKKLMPNGVADFVRWCHEARDEIKGVTVERKPEDYLEMVEESKKREARLAITNQKVFNDLIEQGQHLTKPINAVSLMWKLAKRNTVEASFTNKDIDPKVFGTVAAPYIEQIRQYQHQQDQEQQPRLEALIAKAHETAVATGCGGGSSDSIVDKIIELLKTNSEKSSDEHDRFGSLTFLCRKGHRNTRPRGKLISHCRTCGDSVKC